MTRSELIEKVKLLPQSPGVYMMLDANEKIIYVGKSKSLRNRVSSYFQPLSRLNAKTAKLSVNICDFKCVYTDTETEALILENELIKRHTPKYNIKLKDSKSYPYVRISNAQFPTISLSRARKNDKCKYYGPYTSSKAVQDIIETVSRTFRIASCGKKFEEGKQVCRPCLNYHIGKCIAPCTGKIPPEEYKAIFDDIGDFLNGDFVKVIDNLKNKMADAAEDLKFEAAAQYRDRLAALERLRENQKIISDLNTDRDVFGIYEGETLCVIAVLFIRSGRLIDKELIFFSSDELTESAVLSDLVMRYYSTHEYIPKSVLASFDMNDEDTCAVADFLSARSGKKVEVRTPKKGIGRELANLACENAQQAALQYSKEQGRSVKVLEHIYEHLALDSIPMRIEAYDISNNGKDSMYAGMIVVENGVFKKSDYRSFAIKTVEGTDDYSAMREALTRRLTRLRDALDGKEGANADSSFSALPDLILLDGGVGHVSAIKPLLSELRLPISLFGMVKDAFHKTRTLTDGENEISISHVQDIFTFIYKIQEEVHRYTFSKMDASRRNTVKTSSLEKIEGIGPAKAKAVLKHFKTVTAVKNASVDELAKAPSISRANAEKIYEYFHGNKSEVKK